MTDTSIRVAPVTAEDEADSHPSDGDLAAYLEAALPANERARLEAHTADCEYCRSRLVLAGELIASAPRPRRRPLLYPAGLIAAAAAVAALLLLPGRAASPPEPDQFRATPEASAVQRLRVLQPPRGGVLKPDAPKLVWSELGPDALYQITLSNADGSVLWTDRTSDTVTTPPAPVVRRLHPGGRYFWRVDALLPNLRSITTGDQPFSLADK